MSRAGHKPTKEGRSLVELHAAIGTPQTSIARLIDVAPKTLRVHYRDELDLGAIKANGVVGGQLYMKAKAGDTAACIFWAKTRMGWRETNTINVDPIRTVTEVRHSIVDHSKK